MGSHSLQQLEKALAKTSHHEVDKIGKIIPCIRPIKTEDPKINVFQSLQTKVEISNHRILKKSSYSYGRLWIIVTAL